MKKILFLRFLALLLVMPLGVIPAMAAETTLASWTFTSTTYPSNKTNFSATGGEWQTGSVFYLNGSGSTWNSSKGSYVYTSLTDITITCKLGQALSAGTKLTLSLDAYYNKESNAPAKGFNITANEAGGSFDTTGLSVTSWTLSTTSTTYNVTYTTQSTLANEATIVFKLTKTESAGSGQGYIGNIIIKGDISDGGDDPGTPGDGGNSGDSGDSTVSGTFTKVTSGTIEAGTYVFVGNSNNKALINNTIASDWIYPTDATYTATSITDPASSIVWTVDANGYIQPYESSDYLYASAAKKIALSNSNQTAWSFTLSDGVWDIKGTTSSTNVGSLQFNSTGWRPYTSSSGTAGFQIYKLSVPATETAPTITTQPIGATYFQGETATALSIVASGYPTPTYQWYSNTSNSTLGAIAISGATTASYIPVTTAIGTTYYYCEATNSEGTATSDIVAVTVNPVTYTVTYDANDGVGTMTDSNSPYVSGTTVTTLDNAFTRDGYSFAGWNTAADGNGTTYAVGETFEIAGNVTLYAQWTINQYTVTWKVNGATWGEPATVEYNTKPSMPTEPTSANFDGARVFVGWSAIQNVVDAPSDLFATTNDAPVITGPITFYAVFATATGGAESWEKQSSVPADAAGEYVIVADGTPPYVMKAAIKNSRFENGTNNATLSGDLMTSTPASDEIWIIYKHSDGYYRIKNGSNYAGGTNSKNQGALLTDEADDLAKWTITYNTGFVFYNYGRSKASSDSGNAYLRNNNTNGWATYAASQSNAPVLYKKIGGVTYSNYATEASVSLSYITLDTTSATKTYILGETLNISGVVVTAHFSDSSTQDVTSYASFNPEGGSILSTPGTQTVTVSYGGQIANYEVIVKCTVTYDANGGEGTTTDSNEYVSGTEVATIANGFAKTGYSFTGWNTAADGSGTTYAVGETFEIADNVTLYAQWTINQYTVTWKVNGATWGEPASVEYNTKPSMPTEPTSADFDDEKVFIGWTAEATVADLPADIFTTAENAPVITEDKIFNAVFALASDAEPALTETVGFESSEGYTNGSTYNSKTYNTGSKGSKWTMNYGAFSTTGATHDSQSAQFRIYNGTGGGYGELYNTVAYSGDIAKITFYAKASNAAGKVKVSYSADGSDWEDIETIDLTTTDTKYTENIRAEAHYIKFTAAGDRPSSGNYKIFIDDVEVYTGSTTYSEYAISSSQTLSSISVNASGAKTVYGMGEKLDVTGLVVTAHYSDETTRVISSGLTYSPADKTVLNTAGTQTVTVSYGGKSASYDVTVKCRVVYDANGGEGSVEAELYNKDASVTVADGAGLSREHYDFAGWNTAADGSGTVYAAGDSFSITGLVTLYAQWTIKHYTLTYHANGGTGSMTDEDSPYEANSLVYIKDNEFTRGGYVFTGWDSEPDGTGIESYPERGSFRITGDITLYAQWSKRGENFTIFHESFGNNSESAREWEDSYKVQSGERSVYSGATYTITNAKQSKNSVGSNQSGLAQSSSSSDASFEVGPLDLSTYADGTYVTLSYQWKAASINGTYYTKIYYATSKGGDYTEIPNTAVGATTFVEVSVSAPEAALTATTYIKVVFSTSNTQAVIDEFDISGKQSKADPHLAFDLPVYYIGENATETMPQPETLSDGGITFSSTDDNTAKEHEGNLMSYSAGSVTITATLAESDSHLGGTTRLTVCVVPESVSPTFKSDTMTYSCLHPLDFTEATGVKAYVAKRIGTDDVIVEPYTGYVPANTGLLLVRSTPAAAPGMTRAAAEVSIPASTEVLPVVIDNLLRPAPEGSTIPASDATATRYVFNEETGKFVKQTTDMTSTSDIAYLEIPASDTETREVTFDSVTGIEDVNVDIEDGRMYNIWGQPVDDSYRGFVIKNGKKILKKD